MIDALVGGRLTIKVWMRKITHAPTIISPTPLVPEHPLCKNILKKFMDEELADVIFEVGGEIRQAGTWRKRAKTVATMFYAHRLILQDNAAMLAELYKPGRKMQTISMTDVKPCIFRHLLCYAYGGKVSNGDLRDNVQDIIYAINRFGVVYLKLEAETCHVNTIPLTINNILDSLLYVDAKNCFF